MQHKIGQILQLRQFTGWRFMQIALVLSLYFILPSCSRGTRPPSCSDSAFEKPDERAISDDHILKAQLVTLTDEKERLTGELADQKEEYKNLKLLYDDMLDYCAKDFYAQEQRERRFHDPTWAELKTFLDLDNTKRKKYIAKVYDCTGYAIDLRDNALRNNLRAAFVEIGLGSNHAGHALNAFQTKDDGLIYIDVGGLDKVAYIEIGKPYGQIALHAVKENYIECSGDPSDFWQPIRKKRYIGSLFNYAYFVEYTSRRYFHEKSIKAYNAEVQKLRSETNDYNKEVEKYNARQSMLSKTRLEIWKTELEEKDRKHKSWAANLNRLSNELDIRVTTADEDLPVTHIEIYWP